MIASFLPERASNAILQRQLEESMGMVRTAALGGVFNATIASVTFVGTHWAGAAIAWWFLVAIAAGARWGVAARWETARRQSSAAAGTIELDRTRGALNGIATSNGIIWGGGIALASLIATPSEFNMLTVLCVGMMGAVAITYGPLCRSMMLFIFFNSLGGVFAWSMASNAAPWQAMLLISCFLYVLVRGAISKERNFCRRVDHEIRLGEASATVQLLLNDYAAQTSDWLWEVDADGVILDPSTRFGDAAGRGIELLADAPFVDLFDKGRERDMLTDHLAGGFAFRDLTLQLTIDGAPHWWTLSAQPRAGGGLRGVASDVTSQKRAEAKVSYMAHYDGLTDLANRFLFNEALQRSLHRHGKNSTIAVLCLDLDQFKSVNDTLGHPIGDRLLCSVARRLESVVRDGDMVARLGGDEFAVLLRQGTDEAAIIAIAEAIIAAINEPFIIDDMHVTTSTSVGVALAENGDIDATMLMSHADLALYSAKANGRNRYAHFVPGMDEAARERRELEMDLRAGLSRGEFELHYQPLVNVATGQTVSYEALVRWNHPTRGVIMPNSFIPIAEETGLIVQLGEWVIRTAVAEVRSWPAHLRVSVNLSPAQMRSSNLISTVVNAVARNGIDPGRIELEITESVLMHDSEVNVATLHKLKEFGVRIALDDFGTGYSSLNYLRSFPFDKIKIDKCFVEQIDEREDCRAIVRAVTSLAQSLGMVTTAEGVESQDQLDRLQIEGCDEVLGYLVARPANAAEFTNLRSAAIPASAFVKAANTTGRRPTRKRA